MANKKMYRTLPFIARSRFMKQDRLDSILDKNLLFSSKQTFGTRTERYLQGNARISC